MNCTTKISITEIYDQHHLVTREAAIHVIQTIAQSPCNKIEVDFSAVSFVSRSFADQFHKEKLSLYQKGIEIMVANAQEAVFKMFQTVSKTQSKTERTRNNYSVLHLDTRKSLKGYLSSLDASL